MPDDDRNRDAVAKVFAAFAAGEIERGEELLLEACASDVTVYESATGPFAGTYAGRDAFRELMARIHKVVDMSRVVLERLVSGGDDVVALLRVTDAFRVGAKRREALASEWYRFREGQIVELRPFTWIGPE